MTEEYSKIGGIKLDEKNVKIMGKMVNECFGVVLKYSEENSEAIETLVNLFGLLIDEEKGIFMLKAGILGNIMKGF